MADLKAVYTAVDEQAALDALDAFAVFGHDGYHEKVDRQAAGLERDSRPAGYLLCRAYA